MASAIKNAVKDKFSSNDDTATKNEKSDNYRLRITAGPSYDKTLQRIVAINGASIQVSDEVKLTMRIRDYTGLPSTSPAGSPYFELPEHAKDTFSLAFSITPKQDIPTKDLFFGLDTGHNPIRKFGLPESLVQTAFKIVKGFIDPTLTCDASADEPYVMGPAVTSATMDLCIGEKPTENWDAPAVEMTEGAVGSGAEVRSQAGLPDDASKRRKYLADASHREKFVLEAGRTYYFDFANGYIDWKHYALKLPGFSWSPLKHIGDKSHKIRYVLRDLKSGTVFFVVMCELLAGEEMRLAIREDRPAGEKVL